MLTAPMPLKGGWSEKNKFKRSAAGKLSVKQMAELYLTNASKQQGWWIAAHLS